MQTALLAAALGAVWLVPPRAWALGTCGKGGATGEAKLDLDGKTVNVYVPSSYDGSKPFPLILALHGDEGTASGSIIPMWKPFWKSKGDFILVTPSWGGSWWMNYSSTRPWMEKLLARIYAEYNIDIDKIYATGVSGGSTFLGSFGVIHQEMFAAIQFSCGGAGFSSYKEPPKPECKFPARFVLAADDFMNQYAKPLSEKLKSKGHEVFWVTPSCSGHCCGPTSEYVTKAREFFDMYTHCRGVTGPGCGKVGDLPGSAPPDAPPEPGGGGGYGGDGGTGGGGGGGRGGGSNDASSNDGRDDGAGGGVGGDAGGACACQVGARSRARAPLWPLVTVAVSLVWSRRRGRQLLRQL